MSSSFWPVARCSPMLRNRWWFSSSAHFLLHNPPSFLVLPLVSSRNSRLSETEASICTDSGFLGRRCVNYKAGYSQSAGALTQELETVLHSQEVDNHFSNMEQQLPFNLSQEAFQEPTNELIQPTGIDPLLEEVTPEVVPAPVPANPPNPQQHRGFCTRFSPCLS